MSLDAMTAGQPAQFRLARPVELICFALAVAQVVYVAASFVQGSWLIDPHGQPIATDFVNVWAAGRQVLDGPAAAVYDLSAHKVAEVAAVRHAFDGESLDLSADLPICGDGAGAPPLCRRQPRLDGIDVPGLRGGGARHRRSSHRHLLACAFPGVLANVMAGQNGFVTAALLGGALVLLERRPVLAGVLIGLLSFKPHIGVLIPIGLIAGGHWRAIAAAALVVVALALASVVAFGLDAWEAFFHGLSAASQSTLEQGRAEWGKLQSAFGLMRMIGGGSALAWSIQGALTATVAIVIAALWRSQVSFDLKAAALATGALLATPYIFLYDLVVLAVPMAFLVRASACNGPVAGEMLGLAAAALLIAIFPLAKAPVGFAAVLVVALLIARRASLAPTGHALPFVRAQAGTPGRNAPLSC